jgi:hypothetical protein
MFEDMVHKYQILIDLMIEVMVQYYIQMYEKKLPKKNQTARFQNKKQKKSFENHTSAIFCSVMIIVFELRIKQRHIPRKLDSLRSAMITLGFELLASERLEYGE